MQEHWQEGTGQFNRQIEAIAGRDFNLWIFSFIVVFILALGIFLLGFSSLFWARTPRSAVELGFALLLMVLIFGGYIFYRQHRSSRTRQELLREFIYGEKVQSLALIDPLTQTFNACYLDRVLPREINRANRRGETIALVLIEVAGWSKAKKQRGTLVADQMLVGAADFLKTTFRGSDIVLRYGIKRFLIIMPETTQRQANRAVERMYDRLDPWHLDSNNPFELDLRVGMAVYEPGADADAILKLAEMRLHGEPTGRDLALGLVPCGSGQGSSL